MNPQTIDTAIHEMCEDKKFAHEAAVKANQSRMFRSLCRNSLAIMMSCEPEMFEAALQGVLTTGLAVGYKVGLAKRECEELERMIRV